MRTNYEIVLRAMQQEREIVFPDGFTRTIINGNLVSLIQMWEGGVSELSGPPTKEWWEVDDMTVTRLIVECEKMSDEDIALIAANTALNSLKKDRKIRT